MRFNDRYYLALLNELVTRYGELTEFWLDGAGSAGHVYDFDRYVDNLRVYQPNAMVFADAALLKYGDIRWVGNDSRERAGRQLERVGSSRIPRYRPAEADTPLRKSIGSGIPTMSRV